MTEWLEEIETMVALLSDDKESQDFVRENAIMNYRVLKKVTKDKYDIKQTITKTEDGYSQELHIDNISDKEIERINQEKDKILAEQGWEES